MSINKSFGFLSHAKQFLDAAAVVKNPRLDEKEKKDFKMILPAYYLVGHSIELSLKSYAAKGYKTNELRSKKYGHDLEALLIECKKRKLGREAKLSKHQINAIKLFSDTYKSKRLEYLEYGIHYRLPEYGFIYDVAKHLNSSLAYYASNSPFNKQL
jgi:hypothetical protein